MSVENTKEPKNEAVREPSEPVAKKTKLEDGTPVKNNRVSKRDQNKT